MPRKRLLTLSAAALTMIVLVISLVFVGKFFLSKWQANTENVSTQDFAQSLGSYGLTVSGRVGTPPIIVLDEAISVISPKRLEVLQGTGRVITEDSPVLIAVTSFDGETGEALTKDGKPQLTVGHANVASLGEDLSAAVLTQREGARIVFLRPVSDDAKANPQASNTEINVVDILYAVAQGTEVDVSTGPLTVTIGPEGPIIRHGEEEPAEVTVNPLIKGNGEQVAATDRIVMQYIATGWKDGVVRDSSWAQGLPRALRLATAMPGLRQALIDQRVGSRLAITIPPDLGAGDDTLCIIVDILGTEPTNDQPAQEELRPQSSQTIQSGVAS